jgi:flagellar protein FlaG
MEIRTIGGISAGTRSVIDSAVASRQQQNAAQEQAAVQTAKAVPQVAETGQAGLARKAADQADAQQQTKENGFSTNTEVAARLSPAQTRENAEKTQQAERKDAARLAEDAGRTAQAEKSRQEERTAPLDAAARQAEKERTQKIMDNISESMSTGLDFAVDEDLGRVVVRIVDPETQEVIKQIPSEDALALARAMGKMRGLFVKTSV